MLKRQALYCLSHCPGPSQNFLHIKGIMRKMGCNLLKIFVLQAKYEKACLRCFALEIQKLSFRACKQPELFRGEASLSRSIVSLGAFLFQTEISLVLLTPGMQFCMLPSFEVVLSARIPIWNPPLAKVPKMERSSDSTNSPG